MIKAYKVEVKLSQEQKNLFCKTQGVCRFVYNEMIRYNQIRYDLYKQGVILQKPKFVGAYEFSKFLNNILIPLHGWRWIKEVPSKSVKQALINCDKAFKRMFNNNAKYPKFKKRSDNIGAYLPKDSKSEFTKIYRNKIKIPVFGWVHLKEFGRITKGMDISSCVITKTADRYFISFLVKEEHVKVQYKLNNEVIGIDLGLESFATLSNGVKYKSPNKNPKLNKLRRKLKREQRKLSRKYEQNKNNKEISHHNENKQLIKVQRLYAQISRTLKGYQNNIIDALVRTKPKAFVIETLNIKGMMKNKHLSKAIQDSAFYQFIELLKYKASKFGIDIMQVDQWFPSSKLCNCCGEKNTSLKLSDRTYKCCKCGFELDRDHNAALNLMLQYK